MKKIAIFVCGLIIALNLCACGCTDREPATAPTTTNDTMMPTETMTVPVPETNIPDPEVNGNSTDNGLNDPSTGTNGMGDVSPNGTNGRANSVG